MKNHMFAGLCVCCAVAVATGSVQSGAQPVTAPYTTNLTNLMRGALTGVNVATPIPGASLLLMKDGVTFYHQAFGNAQLNEVLNIDSSTKTLSAAAVLSVVDASPLPFSLDTPLSQYVPGFLATPEKASITVRQAFSHTSGLPGGEFSGALSNPSLTLQQAAALIAQQQLIYGPPGSTFAYGGVSMHAAGAATEAAAGAPFVQLVADRITGPLGMTQTRFELASQTNPRIAGGAVSTARDFGELMEMLRAGGLARDGTRLLSQAAVQDMFTRQPAQGIPVASSPLGSADYGVGVWLDRRDAQGQLTGALAAGARGFSSWIDFGAGVVGVFATDSTSSANVLPFLDLLRDESALQALSPRLAGDANLDDRVGIADFARLAASFNLPGRVWEQGDFTGDGWTSIGDFSVLAANFNLAAPPARGMVPEASSSLALATAAAWIAGRRRGGPR